MCFLRCPIVSFAYDVPLRSYIGLLRGTWHWWHIPNACFGPAVTTDHAVLHSAAGPARSIVIEVFLIRLQAMAPVPLRF